MPDKPRGRRGLVGAASRTAVALLRSSRQRAKLSSLHLPISLHPLRYGGTPSVQNRPLAEPDAPGAGFEHRPAVDPELRALVSRLARSERRNARLRDALRRERVASARASATLEQPEQLIDHLVADLGAAGIDRERARQTVSSVLAGYGFKVRSGGQPTREPSPDHDSLSVPGLDQIRLGALIQQLLIDEPEITSPRYILVVLGSLAADGPSSLTQMARAAKFQSPVSRRRLRLALEGLVRAGEVRAEGDRYALATRSTQR